jgi:hypothetical protein
MGLHAGIALPGLVAEALINSRTWGGILVFWT